MKDQWKTKQYHRCFATVDLSAIEHNLAQLQKRMAPGVKSMAVVKANGYGHGGVRVALHLEAKVDYFAVACLEEALELRAGGVKKPVLILSYTDPSCYDALIRNDLTAYMDNESQAQKLGAAAVAAGKTVKIHVGVDTGMGRIGLPDTQEGASVIQRISQIPGLALEGLFTHYACADCRDKTDKNRQTARFRAFLEKLDALNVQIPIKHICNSAGTMEPDVQYDMCRLGIAMYGIYPSQEMDRSTVDLRPAMEVVSHVIEVKTVPAGTQISYGHLYTADRERRIATVSIGYADGYNRCMTEGGYVLIHGRKAPVTGRVCMDMIMVDVTDIPQVTVGDPAVILGKSGDAEITAEQLGSLCHSFPYEVLCNFMPRVYRVYCQNGEEL